MIRLLSRWLPVRFARDRRGSVSLEFAIIAPVMVMIFFGTVEVSTGVAVSRKVGQVARTLSDLTSQAGSVADADLTGIFTAGSAVLYPYYISTNYAARISEIKIDSAGNATLPWTKTTGTAPPGTSLSSLPAALKTPNTYLIWSSVIYTYRPVIWVDRLTNNTQPTFTITDDFYSRPRQSTCVLYNTTTCP